MADWSLPTVLSNYSTSVLQNISARLNDVATFFATAPTNQPVGSIRYVRASDKFQAWDGALWNDLNISVAGGGTGGGTQALARTGLGLGTMAIQNNNAVNIVPGGNIDASNLTAGLVAQARLGSGSLGTGNRFLYDDQTYRSEWTVISTAVTGVQNNFSPIGVKGNTIIKITGIAPVTFSGLLAGYDGQIVKFINQSGFQADFLPVDGGSLAANRFVNLVTVGPTSLAANSSLSCMEYQYDAFYSSWMLRSHEQGAWITSPFLAANFYALPTMTWTVPGGDIAANAYYLKNKVLFWNLVISPASTTIGGTVNVNLQANMPAGYWAAKNTLSFVNVFDGNGVQTAGLAAPNPNTSVMNFQKIPGTNWTLGASAGLSSFMILELV